MRARNRLFLDVRLEPTKTFEVGAKNFKFINTLQLDNSIQKFGKRTLKPIVRLMGVLLRLVIMKPFYQYTELLPKFSWLGGKSV